MKCLFSIAPEVRKGGESLKCLSMKNSNQTLDRTWSRVDLRIRSVQTAGRDARVKVADQHVRSLTEPERPVMHPVGSACLSVDQTRWRVRSRATGRVRSTKLLSGPLLDFNRTPGVTRPVISSVASGFAFSVVAQVRPDAVVASGRSDLRVRSACAERHLEHNGSILWGCL
jgi:hypothetical protein